MIADTAGRPWRDGVVDFAIGAAGVVVRRRPAWAHRRLWQHADGHRRRGCRRACRCDRAGPEEARRRSGGGGPRATPSGDPSRWTRCRRPHPTGRRRPVSTRNHRGDARRGARATNGARVHRRARRPRGRPPRCRSGHHCARSAPHHTVAVRSARGRAHPDPPARRHARRLGRRPALRRFRRGRDRTQNGARRGTAPGPLSGRSVPHRGRRPPLPGRATGSSRDRHVPAGNGCWNREPAHRPGCRRTRLGLGVVDAVLRRRRPLCARPADRPGSRWERSPLGTRPRRQPTAHRAIPRTSWSSADPATRHGGVGSDPAKVADGQARRTARRKRADQGKKKAGAVAAVRSTARATPASGRRRRAPRRPGSYATSRGR